MRNKLIIAILSCSCLAAGCGESGKESPDIVPTDIKVSLKILPEATRVQRDPLSGKTTFAEGDNVSVWSKGLVKDIDGRYFKVGPDYSLTSSNEYKYNGKLGADFFACYPPKSGSETVVFEVKANQSEDGAFAASDFMTSVVHSDAASEQAVPIPFSHRLSLLRIKLVDIEDAESVVLKNAKTKVSWTMEGDVLRTDDSEISDIILGRNVGATIAEYLAIVPAQVLKGNELAAVIRLNNGNELTWTPESDIVVDSSQLIQITLSQTHGGADALVALSVISAQWGNVESVDGMLTDDENLQ
ncbi:MAG: fimbrillin family protein [Candidatus Cryptobacteroides sp.]